MEKTRRDKLYYDTGEWEFEETLSLHTSIIEEDKDTFTGLLDFKGREIHRIKNKVGF